MHLYAIDIQGQHHLIEGTTTVEESLNSDTTISIEIPHSDINAEVINDIAPNWKIDDVGDNVRYVVKYVNRKSYGNRTILEVRGIPLAIDVLNNRRLYNYYEGEFSPYDVLEKTFAGSEYSFRIMDTYDTNKYIEQFGDGQTVLEVFKMVLDMWDFEFVIRGNQFELYKYVVRRPDYIIHDKINAKKIALEEDGTNFYTYVKAYGDINDGEPLETAGVSYVYIHPLDSVVGRREAPPIKLINNDETSSSASVIRSQLEQMSKDLVDNSMKFTLTADFMALNDYAEAKPKLADEVTFKATNLNYETVVRLIGISTKRDSSGNTKAVTVTYGDLPLGVRYQSNINYAAQFIQDLESGRKNIPSDMLDQAIQVATQLLLNARTELKFTDAQGIWAVNKNNPQEVVVYNSAGLGISDDGGQTFRNAITGAGIVADAITSGTINTKYITISGTTGVFTISGDKLQAIDPLNPNKWVEIAPGQVTINGGGLQVNRPDGGIPTIINGIMPASFGVWRYHPQFINADVVIDGAFFKTSSDVNVVFDAFAYTHDRRYLNIKIEARMSGSDTVSGAILVEGFAGTSLYQTQLVRGNTAGTYSFRIDLGPPTGNMGYFYLKMRTANTNYPILAREIIIAQEG